MKKMVCLLLVLLAGVSSAHADDGGKAFLEKFYQEGVEVDFSESFLKMHLTKNAMQYLKDSYSYDGEGIASWLFYMEGGSDIGEMREVLVTKVKENTYKVIVRSNFNEDTYEYDVLFGLVQIGNVYRIDTMKPGKGQIVSESGIKNGSRWNIGSLDYFAKVKLGNIATFNAMAEGEELTFRLTPIPGKENEYTIGDDPHADGWNPFSDITRVKHIGKDGWNLLCLYDKKGLLQHVLDGSQTVEGEKVAESKWTAQLMGDYKTKFGEPVKFGYNSIQFGIIDLTYEHITFNGYITGVIKINDGTRLQGTWEAVITLDGLTLYRVEPDEYGTYHRKGNKELLTWSRNDRPRFNYTWSSLLNDGQFRKLKKSTLRIMRNEILARHGYSFQSKDLQEYFSLKDWYHPAESNNDVKVPLLEQLNIELIKAEEAKADSERNVKEE